jgi:hypothetical protein
VACPFCFYPRWARIGIGRNIMVESEKVSILDSAGLALFATLAVAFLLGSLAAAGLVTMSLAAALLVGAWLACVLGTFLPILNLSPRSKIVFVTFFGAAFLAIGMIESHYYEPPLTAADIARVQAGIDNFCFFEPRIVNSKSYNDVVPIWAINNGNLSIPKLQFLVSPYWIHGKVKEYPKEYYSVMPSSVPLSCDVGAYAIMLSTPNGVMPLALKPGRYRVEFTTALGTGWNETLTIERSFDDIVGTVDVFVLGKKPYHSPRPAGYVEW